MLLNKKNIVITRLIIFTAGITLCNAGIYFGNKDSSIKVRDFAALEIKTPGLMDITGGNITNQGFGSITGKDIQFNRGTYGFFNSLSDLQAVLISNNNIIQLAKSPTNPFIDGGTMIANPGGLSGVSMQVLEGANIMRGQPLFFGPNDIILEGETTRLAVGVQNTLNTNITLNGGILFLQDDLRLGDDSVILDSGIVVFNNRRLSLGGKAADWNGQIIWDSSLDLHLNSAVFLNGDWLFAGTGQINGNGNIIDLASGGSIVVLPHSMLRLAAVHIKGLAAKGTIKLAPDATLILTDSVIEMDNDFEFNAGTVLVEGNSTVITKDNILSFTTGPDGTKGKLIVDRVGLKYDTLATIDQLNIRPALINDPKREHVEIIGNGDIGTIRQDTVTFHNYRSAPLLLKYAIVAPYRKFEVFPEVNEQTSDAVYNFDVIVNGNTNFMGFTVTDEHIFIITENVHATTQNITLRDLSPKHIGFAPNAKLTFGDNTRISFGRNEELDYKWTFTGSCQLYGGGKILNMVPGGVIEVRGNGSVLLLDGLTINGLARHNIRCKDPGAKIILKNVKWVQDGDFNYKKGALDILDDTIMVGGFKEPFDPSSGNPPIFFSFNYQSTEPLTIQSDSTLSLIRNMVFNYAPIDGNPNLFQFADQSAALIMDQATLAAPTGLILSTGQLLVRNRNFLSGNIIFDPSLFIDQPAGATLEQI